MTDAKSSKMILVYITFDKNEEAEVMARQLVELRLAACCNLIPRMQSFYRWRDKIEQASEIIMLAKTSRERFCALENFVAQNHSYECPCIIAIPVSDFHEPYLA